MARNMGRDINPKVFDDYALLPLAMGYEAIIDPCFVEKVSGYHWTAAVRKTTVYAYRNLYDKNSGRTSVFLHNFIMPGIDGFVVDHIDGNGLNNKLENLRLCTFSQNGMNSKNRSDNTSGHRGVFWVKRRGKWNARIKAGGKTMCLGYYDNKDDAIMAYEVAREKYHCGFIRSTKPSR